jgi:hypothetical protein
MRRLVDLVPLTWLGALVGAAAVLGLWWVGYRHQDLVLFVAGYGVLAVVALVLVAVVLTAAALAIGWRSLPRPDERVEAGVPLPTGFSLPSLWWLPFVSLRWEWVTPELVTVQTTARGGRLWEQVIHGERGEHRTTVRRVVVEDVFGLSRIALRLSQPTVRTVLPARGRPPTAPLLQALAGGDHVSHPAGPPDGDLVEMRRYVAGDPIKRVLWKTFAKTRTLMVRLPERAVSPTRRTLAYLVAGDGDEPPAALARMALESGALGPDWRFGADGATEDAQRLPEALALIVKSRAARGSGGKGLAGFVERARDFGTGRCVIFVPAKPGPWLAPVAEQIKRRPAGVEVVLGTDGVRPPPARGRWKRAWLLAEEEPTARNRAAEVEAVSKKLAAAGAAVTVIDRPTGKGTTRSLRRRAS